MKDASTEALLRSWLDDNGCRSIDTAVAADIMAHLLMVRQNPGAGYTFDSFKHEFLHELERYQQQRKET
jgi:hypothetical protein